MPFPNRASTGPDPGTAFQNPVTVGAGPGWHYDPRGWVTIDGAGTVFDGFASPVPINVTANAVTVSNCLVAVPGSAANQFGISLRHVASPYITRCRIYSPDQQNRLLAGVKDIYGDVTNPTVTFCDIWNTSTGVQFYQGLVQENFIHDPGYQAGDHLNGFTANQSTGPLEILGNTIINPYSQTDCIGLFQDTGTIHDVTIDSNILAGGDYPIYGGDGSYGPTSNIRITNNRIADWIYMAGGQYGVVAKYTPDNPGNEWSGNVWYRDGSVIPSP